MSEQLSQGKLYSFSHEDFLTPVADLVTRLDYNKDITRDSWMIWLATSFQVSLGSLEVQKAFLEWWRINRQLDWKKSVTSFFKLGQEIPNWSFLSDAEIDLFCKPFRNVGDHGDNRSLSNIEILNAAETQIVDAIIYEQIPPIVPTAELMYLPPNDLIGLLSVHAVQLRNERLERARLRNS